jgi:PTS system nitrogen regulatory IIA component
MRASFCAQYPVCPIRRDGSCASARHSDFSCIAHESFGQIVATRQHQSRRHRHQQEAVFEQAGLLFENNHGVARATVTDNLFARESLGSTGLGAGVAIPHGRIKGLKQPLAAFMRLAEPIPFESPDGKPVSLLIFLLGARAGHQQHLKSSRKLPSCCRTAKCAKAWPRYAEAVHQLLTEWHP